MLTLRNVRLLFFWLGFIALTGCDPWFSYSPYGSQVDQEYHDITLENLQLIRGKDTGESKPFKVALIADTHYHFANLSDAITDINERGDFDFAIVVGDITENGLKQEFIFFHEAMKALNIPYLTVIGNHDYLSNGEQVYREMFGDYNYTFVFNNTKFVVFDNVRWESEKVPDFDWLKSALQNAGGYDRVIPFSHIPPFDGQMEEFRESYHELLVQSGVTLSVHAHNHQYTLEELYGDGVMYHTVPTPQFREYSTLTITPEQVLIEKIEY